MINQRDSVQTDEHIKGPPVEPQIMDQNQIHCQVVVLYNLVLQLQGIWFLHMRWVHRIHRIYKYMNKLVQIQD